MTHDLELEEELQRLGRLLAPESSIVDRVMERIDELPPERARVVVGSRVLWYSGAGLAASAALLLAVHFDFASRLTSQSTTAIVQPPIPSAAAHLVDESRWFTTTEKAVTLPNDLPAQEVIRQESVHVQWHDDQQNATMQVTLLKQPAIRMTMDVY
jgi:hypothetical protein